MSSKAHETLKALAAVMDVDEEFLEQCFQSDALRLEEGLESDPALLARIRRLQRICRGMEMDAFAGSIIVDLLERVEQMERELEQWRAAAEAHGIHRR